MAIVRHATEVPAAEVALAGVEGVSIQWLVSPEDRPATFCMRLFSLTAAGFTPRHAHPWEHEVFILAGEGTLVTPDGEVPLRPRTVVYVPAGEEHQFRSGDTGPLEFLCLVPKEAEF